jgi:hypothetical protein
VVDLPPYAWVNRPLSGLLCRPDPDHLAGTILQVAGSPRLRRHLGASAARAAQKRSWERALTQLADGYRGALELRQLLPGYDLASGWGSANAEGLAADQHPHITGHRRRRSQTA